MVDWKTHLWVCGRMATNLSIAVIIAIVISLLRGWDSFVSVVSSAPIILVFSMIAAFGLYGVFCSYKVHEEGGKDE